MKEVHSPQQEPVIQLCSLSKRYSQAIAVEGLDAIKWH